MQPFGCLKQGWLQVNLFHEIDTKTNEVFSDGGYLRIRRSSILMTLNKNSRITRIGAL